MSKEIPLTQGRVALVDDEDFERVNQYKWYANLQRDGVYRAKRNVRRNNRRRTVEYLARFILTAQCGEDVDHWNGDTLDNRKQNLRRCSHEENVRSRQKQRHWRGRKTSSSFKGVSWLKANAKWVAYIGGGASRKYLGLFTSEVQAAMAYNEAAMDLFGEFAYLNQT